MEFLEVWGLAHEPLGYVSAWSAGHDEAVRRSVNQYCIQVCVHLNLIALNIRSFVEQLVTRVPFRLPFQVRFSTHFFLLELIPCVEADL